MIILLRFGDDILMILQTGRIKDIYSSPVVVSMGDRKKIG